MIHWSWLLCLLSLAACDRLLPFGSSPPESRAGDVAPDRPGPSPDLPAPVEGRPGAEWPADRPRGAADRSADRARDKGVTKDLPQAWKDKPQVGPAVEAGICPGGMTWCNGTCVLTETNPSNCGSCGVICSLVDPCRDFTCQKGGCVPTSNKPNGTKCGAGTQICCGGACCPPSVTSCPATGC